jgi:hypothetical protein
MRRQKRESAAFSSVLQLQIMRIRHILKSVLIHTTRKLQTQAAETRFSATNLLFYYARLISDKEHSDTKPKEQQ